jgi:RNA polymerase sigma factor (sigma-70 family)
LTDGQLLEAFLSGRHETAFEELLKRHGPLVLGVCRRILRDPHDADDAFQATFLVLLRKAGSIGKKESVASWLYGVAYRLAVRAKAKAHRRQAHERHGTPMTTTDPFEELIWRDLRHVLDEEINQLPEPYRAAVVLCFLEGKPYAEAGRLLGCSKATVSLRLARARNWLRERLDRRGVALSLGLFLALMGQRRTLVPVPAELNLATAQAAWLWREAEQLLRSPGEPSAGTPGLIGVSAPATGLLVALGAAKVKAVAALVVLLGVLAIGVGTLSWWSEAGWAGAGKSAPAQPHGKKTMADRLQGLTPPK